MRYLDAAGVRQLKELNDAAYVGKEEYNDDTMVISAALNDLNSRVTTAESEIAGFSEGDENIIETVKVNGTALTVTDKAVDVTVPTTLASLTDDSTHRLVTDTEKTKLQGIAAGAEVNVQSDWSVTDSTSDAYIVNKPTIPTKVSDLTNDSGFTTNTGTITGVTMNGVSKGTSGVVDLGTVITDVSGKADASAAIGTLSLAIDNTNYQITLSGTKVDGTTFTVSNVIDLPLESVVVNGSYNNTTKKVVLTLQNGNTVDFSVADLVAGLQSEITSTNKLSADLIEDGTTNKVVTATEKSTWNGKQDALNAGTFNVMQNGVTAGSYSINQSGNSSANIIVPTKVSDLTNDSGFTSNAGTITGITMNNVSKGTSGVVDLGTVLTSHQDISGKEDTSNKVTSLSSSSTDTQYPTAKTVYDFVSDSMDSVQRVFSEAPANPKEGDILAIPASSSSVTVALNDEVNVTPPAQLQFTFNLTSAQLSSIEAEANNGRWENLLPIWVNGSMYQGGQSLGDFWFGDGELVFYGDDEIPVPTDGTPFVVDIPESLCDGCDPITTVSVYSSLSSDLNANVQVSLKATVPEQNKEYVDGAWVDRGAVGVTGVKGNSEESYRTGNVNITAANIGAAASSHTHGWINNDGTISASGAIDSGDKLVFCDYSASNKIIKSTVSFDGSTTTKALTQKGTFETFLQTAPVTSVNGNTGAVTISVPTKVSDLTNDSGFTANTGTITSVKMNGSTVSSSGEADLGTVITAHAKHKLTATNDTASSTSGTITYVESLTGTNTATDGDLTVTATRKTVTIPSAPGTLTTTSTTALSTATNEALSGSISLHKVAKTGTYSDLIGTPTIPTVNDSTISIQKGGTAVDSFTTNASSGKTINIPNELPSYSSSDSGKILSVNSSGALVWITPSYVYSGSSAPSNSIGNNGDIYLQTS